MGKRAIIQIDLGREWRGGQAQTLQLTEDLKKNGWPVFLAARGGSPLQQRAVEIGVSVIPLNPLAPFAPLTAWRLRRELKALKPGILHFHDSHAITIGRLAAPAAALKVISRKVDFPLQKNFLSRWKYGNGIDAVIAVSRAVAATLARSGIPERLITVIPDGCDTKSLQPTAARSELRRRLGLGEHDIVAGYVAAMTAEKGHRDLLEAVRLLKDDAAAFQLLLVGDGPLRAELEKLNAQGGTAERVRFLGFQRDLADILHALDFYVASPRHEGFGSVVLAAQACGLAVAATRTGGIPENVLDGETGLLVPASDPAALARCIASLASHPDLRARLGTAGRSRVRAEFSRERMAKRTIALYSSLLEKKELI